MFVVLVPQDLIVNKQINSANLYAFFEISFTHKSDYNWQKSTFNCSTTWDPQTNKAQDEYESNTAIFQLSFLCGPESTAPLSYPYCAVSKRRILSRQQ